MPVCSCPLGTGFPESTQEFAGSQLKHPVSILVVGGLSWIRLYRRKVEILQDDARSRV